MRVLIFTKKLEYMEQLKRICYEISSSIYVEQVTDNQMISISLTDKNNLYIIDDNEFSEIDENYLKSVKNLKIEVLVLIDEMKAITKYLGLNLNNYFVSPLDYNQIELSISDAYKNFLKLKRFTKKIDISEKFIIKSRAKVIMINYKDILFFEKSNKNVTIHTRREKYHTFESLKSIESKIPKYMFRVHNSYIVNFDHIFDIKEVNSRMFFILFEGCHDTAIASKYMAEALLRNNANRQRVNNTLDIMKRMSK